MTAVVRLPGFPYVRLPGSVRCGAVALSGW